MIYPKQTGRKHKTLPARTSTILGHSIRYFVFLPVELKVYEGPCLCVGRDLGYHFLLLPLQYTPPHPTTPIHHSGSNIYSKTRVLQWDVYQPPLRVVTSASFPWRAKTRIWGSSWERGKKSGYPDLKSIPVANVPMGNASMFAVLYHLRQSQRWFAQIFHHKERVSELLEQEKPRI